MYVLVTARRGVFGDNEDHLVLVDGRAFAWLESVVRAGG
jgi:hypothetical protein